MNQAAIRTDAISNKMNIPNHHYQPLEEEISISFEFFPVENEKSEASLWQTISWLECLDPAFVSVTYGAGGSTCEKSRNTVKKILDKTSMQAAAHLTCVGASRDQTMQIVEDFAAIGIKHIVALRGDPPQGATHYNPHPQGFANAAELVKAIADTGRFTISVAAYPEVHPAAHSPQSDIDFLKRKVDAGADRAVTQFFFEADTYFRFLDRVHAAGIDIPIIPGILPVTNFNNIKNFANNCGATIPEWLARAYEGLNDQPKVRQYIAASFTAELCSQLKNAGVHHFHFYTLNRWELTHAICLLLGVHNRVPLGGLKMQRKENHVKG